MPTTGCGVTDVQSCQSPGSAGCSPSGSVMTSATRLASIRAHVSGGAGIVISSDIAVLQNEDVAASAIAAVAGRCPACTPTTATTAVARGVGTRCSCGCTASPASASSAIRAITTTTAAAASA